MKIKEGNQYGNEKINQYRNKSINQLSDKVRDRGEVIGTV